MLLYQHCAGISIQYGRAPAPAPPAQEIFGFDLLPRGSCQPVSPNFLRSASLRSVQSGGPLRLSPPGAGGVPMRPRAGPSFATRFYFCGSSRWRHPTYYLNIEECRRVGLRPLVERACAGETSSGPLQHCIRFRFRHAARWERCLATRDAFMKESSDGRSNYPSLDR